MILSEIGTEKIIFDTCFNNEAIPHTHNFLEIGYVKTGQANHWFGTEKSIISAGKYFIVDQNTIHSYKSTSSDSFEIINCLFEPSFIDKRLTQQSVFSDLLKNYLIKMNVSNMHISPSNHVFDDKDGKILDLFTKMNNEYEKKEPGYKEMLRSMLIEMIILTVRTLTQEVIDSDSPISYIKNYVNDNYMKKVTLTDISKKLNYSPTYLSNKFKAEEGIGFADFLEQTRINEACNLLLNTKLNIPEIAFSVGYTDVNFFYKIFKRHMKSTPLAIRKKLNNNLIKPHDSVLKWS